LGGIANISFNLSDQYIAFDVCPANRVLNMLADLVQKEFDAGGQMAAKGRIHEGLLQKLDELNYYKQPYPKSLDNSFGTETVFPLIQSFQLTPQDALRTYVEHIVHQLTLEISNFKSQISNL